MAFVVISTLNIIGMKHPRALLCVVALFLWFDQPGVHVTGSSLGPLIFNSSAVCTQSGRTVHRIDCKKVDPPGLLALIAVKKIFYGAIPLTSGCNTTECCGSNPDQEDCVFQSDYQLDTAAVRCSGSSSCVFGLRAAPLRQGNCSNSTLYPPFSSYSSVEFECVGLPSVNNICHRDSVELTGQRFYLSSNNFHVNDQLQETHCSCLFHTKCGASIVVEAVMIQLQEMNSSVCIETVEFGDLKVSSLSRTYTCFEEKRINNEVIFRSQSNAAGMRVDIQANHTSKLFMFVSSSDSTSRITVKCGKEHQIEKEDPRFTCPIDEDLSTTAKPIVTTVVTTGMPTSLTTTDGENSNTGGDEKVAKSQSSSDDLTGVAIAGIALSVVVFIAIIIQIAVFVLRRKKSNNSPEINMSEIDNESVPPAYTDTDHIYHTANETPQIRRSSEAYNTGYSSPEELESAEATGGMANTDPRISPTANPLYFVLEKRDKLKGDPPAYSKQDVDDVGDDKKANE